MVELLLVAVRLVMVAFVVVELPMMRSVMDAKVATSEEMKELVEVLLVAVRLVATRSVAVALPIVALVASRFVVVTPVADAVVRVVCPVTESVPPTLVLPEVVRFVAEAFVRVV